ncbi:MAG: NAD(P)H-binding protein [Anaerolineales bacterium]|nr:NAD(P)H-binding protein [Anaerolineales bacterium]
MRLAIFGATGKTGQILIDKAIDAGHQVTALARTPSELSIQNAPLKVVEGDAMDLEAVMNTISGTEAVLSVMPQHSVSIANILASMEEYSIRRVVVAAGAGVPDPNDEPQLINHLISFLIRTFSRTAYEEAIKQNEIIRASNVDWTICRAPMLTGDPEGPVQVTYVGKEMGRQLSRASYAQFILNQAEDTRYIHQAPVISSAKS